MLFMLCSRSLMVMVMMLAMGGLAVSDGTVAQAGASNNGNGLATPDDASTQVATPWHPTTVQDLWNEYRNIFKFGNRNAASHLWSTFILQRSAQMSPQKLELMFSGFCAVSGSPVRPNDYNRYLLRLDMVTGKKRTGTMHYCCWPCVCDTQDFIRVDTKTITTAEGPKKYHFTVLGNPCDRAYKLNEPFIQPFGVRKTTLAQEAAEVRCVDGKLQGATLSDNGYPIINMFFDLPNSDELSHAGDEVQNEVRRRHATAQAAAQNKDNDVEGRQNTTLHDANSELSVVNAYMDESPEGLARRFGAPEPGRVRMEGGVQVADEYEWKDMCSQRAAAGYNSGMGEIFRKVAEISSPAGVSRALPSAGAQ